MTRTKEGLCESTTTARDETRRLRQAGGRAGRAAGLRRRRRSLGRSLLTDQLNSPKESALPTHVCADAQLLQRMGTKPLMSIPRLRTLSSARVGNELPDEVGVGLRALRKSQLSANVMLQVATHPSRVKLKRAGMSTSAGELDALLSQLVKVFVHERLGRAAQSAV